jgi:transcriptional regulator with XRE-family HTH domain
MPGMENKMKLSDYNQKLQQSPEYIQAMDKLALHFELANAILRARLRKGWTQTDLAKAVGTKQANISRIEAGLGNPTLTLIRKLVKALDLDVWFMEKQVGKPISIATPVSVQTISAEPYPPQLGLEPVYKVISDASADSEGYKV